MTESMTNKIAEPEVGGSLTAKETELTKEAGPEEPKKVIHPADVIVPTWEVFELRHRLTRSDVSQAERTKDQDELITYIRKDKMSAFYEDTCKMLGWTVDSDLLGELKGANAETLSGLDDTIKSAKEQYGDSELKDAKFAKAHHFSRIGDYKTAMALYEEILEAKGVESTAKVNIYLNFVRIGLFLKDAELTTKSIDKAEKQFLVGGDWEIRNRMRIYKALHLAANKREFAQASELLLSGLATFTATELISFEHFVTLTVLLSMCSLSRPELKSKALKAPELLQVFAENSTLRDFFLSFMSCQYDLFFRTFPEASSMMKTDMFVGEHYRYFVRQTRLVAYRQYLAPFKRLTLKAMAEAFGVSESFVEDELTSFIPSGKLKCRIDRVTRTIECDAGNEEDEVYVKLMRAGDALMNNIQMLSRVIDM